MRIAASDLIKLLLRPVLSAGAVVMLIQSPCLPQSQASSYASSQATSEAEWAFDKPFGYPFVYYGYDPYGYYDDFNIDAYTNSGDYDNAGPEIRSYAAPRVYARQRTAYRTFARPAHPHRSKPVTLFNQNHRSVGTVY
jgi:hypothetical protein